MFPRRDFFGKSLGDFAAGVGGILGQKILKDKQDEQQQAILNQIFQSGEPFSQGNVPLLSQLDPRTLGILQSVHQMNQPTFSTLPQGAEMVRRDAQGNVSPVATNPRPIVPQKPNTRTERYTTMVGGKPHVFVRNIDAATGAQIGEPQDWGEAPASGSMGNMVKPEDSKAIADAIRRGEQPPDMKGLYRFGAPVRAELAKGGYDLATATRDWQAINKFMTSMNSTMQVRLRQAVDFTSDTLPQIEDYWNRLKKTGLPTGYKMWNKAALTAAKNLPGEAGVVANNLDALLADFTSELGTVYKGGNSSTDESLKIAATNLKSEWNPQTFEDALRRLRRTLEIRRNSIRTSMPASVSPDNPYMKNVTPQGTVQGERIRVRRKSDGKTGTIDPKDFNAERYDKIQ